MRIKLLLWMLVLSFPSVAKEIVKNTGLGIAETKVRACEIALDHARREAAQSATAIVSSKYESTETDQGINHRQDHISTTKAFAKLISKKEVFQLDGDSGLIKCEVIASFNAGFVEAGSINSAGSSTTRVEAVAFKSGEPFCSKRLNGCFREYYSKELDVFGIQFIKGQHFYINSINYREKDYFLITEVFNEKISTKEKFIESMKKAIAEHNPNNIHGNAKGHVWGKMGYKKQLVHITFTSYMTEFTQKESASQDFIDRVDEDIQSALDLAIEF